MALSRIERGKLFMGEASSRWLPRLTGSAPGTELASLDKPARNELTEKEASSAHPDYRGICIKTTSKGKKKRLVALTRSLSVFERTFVVLSRLEVDDHPVVCEFELELQGFSFDQSDLQQPQCGSYTTASSFLSNRSRVSD